MQFLAFLLASASIGFAVAAPEPQTSAHPLMTAGWCNGGTPGSGECEAKKLHTYCVSLVSFLSLGNLFPPRFVCKLVSIRSRCTDQKRDEFVIWRKLYSESENASNGFDCPDGGWVYCA
ncbi:hypothetical protein E4U38_001098 [Claviceps purpurea]|nr:hypothetical protein E4U38_001098 [Claviceps purpurea]